MVDFLDAFPLRMGWLVRFGYWLELRYAPWSYEATYRLWYRFRGAPWQPTVRNGLVPVTIGLVIASGTVMARAADTGPAAAAMTVAVATLMLSTRLNPLWVLLAGGALGGFGLL